MQVIQKSGCSQCTGHHLRGQSWRRGSRALLPACPAQTPALSPCPDTASTATPTCDMPWQATPAGCSPLRGTRAKKPEGHFCTLPAADSNTLGQLMHFTLQVKTEMPKRLQTFHCFAEISGFVLFNDPSETVLRPLTNQSKHAKKTYDDQMAHTLILQHPYVSSVFSDCF